MSEEEIKAIEQFKEINLEDCSCEKCLYQEIEECRGCPTMIKETILNLIEKQDKMIDYMAEEMIMTRLMTTEEYKTHKYSEYSNGQIVMSKKEKIEYFRKRVEEDAKN